jgi:hypothetical protein
MRFKVKTAVKCSEVASIESATDKSHCSARLNNKGIRIERKQSKESTTAARSQNACRTRQIQSILSSLAGSARSATILLATHAKMVSDSWEIGDEFCQQFKIEKMICGE